jgi:uncharacterized membrane protein YdjX (TVP38/TMEM64 family)
MTKEHDMNRKVGSLLLVAILVIIAVTQKTWFTETIKSGGDFAILASFAFCALLVFVPVVPFIVAAGIIGNLYGTWKGTAITLSGAMFGTTVMFLLIRLGFSSWAQSLLRRYPRVEQYESYFETHSFFTILIARLIPVIPATLVNVLSGLSKVPFFSFFFASLLGKLPVNLLYNFAGKEMSGHKWFSFLIYGVYFFIVLVATYLYMMKERQKISAKRD